MTRSRLQGICEQVCNFGMMVKVIEVDKVNGKRLGIVLDDAQIAPTIYLDGMEDSSDAELADFVLKMMCRALENAEFNLEEMFQPENIIGFVLNRATNEELLEKVPHIDILDLAICFRFSKGDKSCLIHYDLAERCQYSLNELYEIALDNTTPQIAAMRSFLEAFLDEDDMPDIAPLLIVTNKNRYYGAFEGFVEENLNDLARNLNDNLYIIPSSIHECLVLPASMMKKEDLRKMIFEVNTTQVSADEILSYNLYHYDRKTGKITIA